MKNFYKLGWFLASLVVFTSVFAFRLTRPLGFGCVCPDIPCSFIHVLALVITCVLMNCMFWGSYLVVDFILVNLTRLVKQNRVAVDKLDKEITK